RKGHELYEQLVLDQAERGQTLADARRLQVVSVREEAYLPVELVYDRGPVDPRARLCPNARATLAASGGPTARAALQGGRCAAGRPPLGRDVVCPLGFWCMQKVIERYAFDAEVARSVGADFAVWPEPSASDNRIGALTDLVFAFSKRIDERDGSTAG